MRDPARNTRNDALPGDDFTSRRMAQLKADHLEYLAHGEEKVSPALREAARAELVSRGAPVPEPRSLPEARPETEPIVRFRENLAVVFDELEKRRPIR